MRGPRVSAELIQAVRDCAARRMSMGATADHLATRTHPLTRSAIAGIATRNGISFGDGRAPQGSRKPKAPAAFKPKPDPLLRQLQAAHAEPPPIAAPTPVVAAAKTPAALIKKPGILCSWAGCGTDAAPGAMFCSSHGRKGLM